MTTSDNRDIDNAINLPRITVNDAGDSGIDVKNTESLETIMSDETVIPEINEKIDNEPEWIDMLGSGSVMKKIIKIGTPDTRPKRLQNCKIRYECSLDDGDIVDTSEEFTLQLGDCEVVQGLDVALGLMDVGEISRFKMEPRLAFGAKGLPPLIPSDATIHYEVELISVEPEIDPENLTISQRKLIGNKKRERGNWWYGRGDNNLAIQCYRRALDYLDEVEGGIMFPTDDNKEVTDSDLQDILEDRISVFNNMAAAQLKMNLHDAALNSLQTVLRCQPDNLKALFRKAKVYRGKNDLQAAFKCLQKANEISPNVPEIQKEINVITSLMQKQKVSERELARRMFNGPKINKDKDGTKKESNKIFIWAALATSVAVGFMGLAAYKFKF